MANRSSPDGYISPEYAAELGRQVDELEAENATLRAQSEWQPIETAPKDGSPFLSDIISDVPVLTWYVGGKWPWAVLWHPGRPKSEWEDMKPAINGFDLHGAGRVYWMPLPAPPFTDSDAK